MKFWVIRNIIDLKHISYLLYIWYKYTWNMFLLSLVYLYFCGKSLKWPLRVTNCCISPGCRQLSHTCQSWSRSCPCAELTPVTVVGKLRTAAMLEDICFQCLSFKHVQAIQFSSVTTVFLIFIRFSFWKKKHYQKCHEEFAKQREDCVHSSWQQNFQRFQCVQVFPLTTSPHFLRRWDFLLYRSCSWTWVGRNSSDFFHAVHNPPCLLSCTNCWLLNPQGEGQDKKHFQGFERMELTRQENVSLKARINNTKIFFSLSGSRKENCLETCSVDEQSANSKNRSVWKR